MTKPRMFLGSSAGQAKLVEGLARGLEDVAHVEPWMTSFNPGTATLEKQRSALIADRLRHWQSVRSG